MANKVKCTCGHSWDKSDSSKKDMYVCHICGKNNNMKNGGWLDKYDTPQAQNGIEGTMGGLTDKGFNYNGAWGGPSMAMGGSLPGSVGFTYARTGSIPSNGPYAKKTKASAQNGKEMKFYQEGLDWKPRNISRDGTWLDKYDVPQAQPGKKQRAVSDATRVAIPERDMRTMDEAKADAERALFFQRLANQPVIQSPKGKQLSQEEIRKKNKEYAQQQGRRYNETTGAVEPLVSANTERTMNRAMENIVEPMVDLDLALGAGKLVGAGAKALGKYAVEETALKNAYKLNPLAFKANPEAYYRMIGNEGLEDALESGVIRPKPGSVHDIDYPTFKKGVPLDNRYATPAIEGTNYGGPYMVESTGNKMVQNRWAASAPDKDVFIPRRQLTTNNPGVKFYKQDWLRGYKPIETPSVSNVSKSIENLQDLQAAKEFAQKYGYDFPNTLERIAQSDMLTDRTVRGLMNRHNTFVRGVSTNWDEIGKKNPEILRHLEGKGFDLSTKEGTKQAAEYMATHIPISTGYGRADLNQQVFNRGMEGLYTSNSIPTAEGYTYGQGYITKVRKPTDFSSANRQDWITKNNPEYYKDVLPSGISFKPEDLGKLTRENVNSLLSNARITTQDHKSILEYFDQLSKVKKKLKDKYGVNESTSLFDNVFDTYSNELEVESNKLLQNLFDLNFNKKLLRTERSNVPTDAYAFLQRKEGNAKALSDFLKTQPYQQKMKEVHNLGESLNKYTWEEQQPIRAQIDKLTKETNELYNQSIQDYMKLNHPDYDPIDKYAHYIHLGTPGEKVLEPIKSWEITPEIWKNKSRAHTNSYTKKLSALEEGGVIKDDMGYWNPDNWGKPVEIGSNDITMQGVYEPLLGVSDEGDVQYMEPGKDYKFKGKKVTEYPVKKWLDKYK